MHVSIHHWDNSPRSRRSAAGFEDREVQVWIAPVQFEGNASNRLARLLSHDERERAGRFRVETTRQQFTTGRAVLRQLLGACLNVEAAALTFRYQSRGKPFLNSQCHDTDVRFNVSHSGSWVAIALARGQEVGIDIEWIHSSTDWWPIANRVFSSRELGAMHALPESQQAEAFYKGWTRKEACLKATGEGLRDDLSAIEVTFVPGESPRVLHWPDITLCHNQWVIQDISMPPEFVGAVASTPQNRAGEDGQHLCQPDAFLQDLQHPVQRATGRS